MLDFYARLAAVLEVEPVVVATVIWVQGSVPRSPGAKMAIASNQTWGTIGGGAGEAKVIQQAVGVLATGRGQRVKIDLYGPDGVCGGMMEVWLGLWRTDVIARQIRQHLSQGKPCTLVTPLMDDGEAYLGSPQGSCWVEELQPPEILLVVGAGHCAVPLAQIALLVGFRVVVVDDRPELAVGDRFPGCLVIADTVAAALPQIPPGKLYAALVTRGYQQDVAAIQALANHPLAYLGVIGSSRRIQIICQSLRGYNLNELTNFHAPIGLDIGAQTPEEIAVSICAELIKVKRSS